MHQAVMRPPVMRQVCCSLICAFLLSFLISAPALADGVPSFQEVTGHDLGERITVHHEMAVYLRALEAASPRVRVVDQGASWEGRRLLLAIVTSAENHARLDAIQAGAQQLGDPRRTDAAALEALVAEQPAVVWLGGSIHGFELSGSEGLLKLLEHLTTAEDEAIRTVLAQTVVLIDPMLNPDGRDAFAHFNHQRLGRLPNPRREDWNNDTISWEGLSFRTGHYFFDTNRDWFAHTQAETRARIPTLLAWRPQVVVDAHEMGADAEFYFDPATDPYTPFFPGFARSWFTRFNAAYAAAFDAAGFEYMTGERYNYWYPGYTTSYGSLQGAVGMLYEQGSSRGLAITRADDSVRTLGDALTQQYTAAWAAVQLAARERETLLRDYAAAHREAIADGGRGVRRYLLSAEGSDPGLVTELVALLRRNGIEVGRLGAEARLGGVRGQGGEGAERTFPAGTYVVEAAQPRNRLVRSLLEPDVPLPEDFLRAARQRIDRGEGARFYDITSWSLPLLFNVDAYSSTDGRSLSLGEETTETRATPDAGYAYLLDGRNAASMAVLHHLKARGHRAAVLLHASQIEGGAVPAGTVIVRVGQNGEAVHEAVRELAERYGVAVRAVGSGLGEAGHPSLGSGDHTVAVRTSEIALLADMPVHGYSFGWTWYVLDRQYELPVTVLRVPTLADTRLDRFDVLVVPDLFSAAALAERLGEAGRARLSRWVEDGGTLVALGEAVDFVRENLELTALRSWYEEHATEEQEGEEKKKVEPRHFDVPGAFVRAVLDPEVWLTAGYGEEMPFLINSDRILLPPTGPPDGDRRIAVRYADQAPLRLAGHLWPETLERVGGAVLAYEERVGEGRVILFPEDLSFRGYWRGSDRLLLNAVVLGPSAP